MRAKVPSRLSQGGENGFMGPKMTESHTSRPAIERRVFADENYCSDELACGMH